MIPPCPDSDERLIDVPRTRFFVFLGAIAALVAPVSAETVPPGGTDPAALFQRGDALYQRR